MTRDAGARGDRGGAALVEEAIAAGAGLLGTGEMGIGNTTAASAITAAITGAPRRGGHRPRHRRRRRGLAAQGRGGPRGRWPSIARIRPTALDVLAKVGGFEIAGLVGVILAGAARRVPGRARRLHRRRRGARRRALAPAARHALFASHRSAEPGHAPGARAPRPHAVPRPRHAAGRGDRRRAVHRPRARGGGASSPRWRRSSRPASSERAARCARRAIVDAARAPAARRAGAARPAAPRRRPADGASTARPRVRCRRPAAHRLAGARASPRSCSPSATRTGWSGVTDFCDYPAAAPGKPSVGGMVDAEPRDDRGAPARPGRRHDRGQPRGDVEQLDAARHAGLPGHANRRRDVLDSIERVGALTGREADGRAVAAGCGGGSRPCAARVAPLPRPRVLYVLWPDPLIVPGRGRADHRAHRAGRRRRRDRRPTAGVPALSLETAVAGAPEVDHARRATATGHGGRSVRAEKWERLRRACPPSRPGACTGSTATSSTATARGWSRGSSAGAPHPSRGVPVSAGPARLAVVARRRWAVAAGRGRPRSRSSWAARGSPPRRGGAGAGRARPAGVGRAIVVLELRLPRVIVAVLAGGALAVAGVGLPGR